MPGLAVAQKRSLPRTVYRTFTLVDREFEPLGQVAGDGGHNPFAACPRCNVDVAVVGVSAKAMTPSFQFLVQFVKEDVGQQRGDWPTLSKVMRYQK